MKYFKYLFFIMVLASASSCKKFLDTKPSDFLAPETFYATDAQLISALAAVYDPLGWETMYGNNLFSNLTIATDESFWNRSAQTTGTQVYSFDYAHADVSGLWAACYTGIERANILIANINKPEMDETKRQDILGQALFLRGYYYFLLASNFGGAPLKLVPQPSVSDAQYINVPRSSVNDVYTQVLKDLTDAEGKLNSIVSNNNAEAISKTAVQGILARVCLTMAGSPVNDASKYAEALSWAKKVQSSGMHSLNTTYDASLLPVSVLTVLLETVRTLKE